MSARKATATRSQADARAAAPAGAVPFKKSFVREWFDAIAVAVILALFVRTFVFQTFKIPSGSMEDTLLIGDHLIVNKMVFAQAGSALERTLLPMGTVERGDIVVFKSLEEPERDLIKRVIGLPGESVELKGKTVYINGTPLDEPYTRFSLPSATGEVPSSSADRTRQFGPLTVPADHYFMMGDNRDNSYDSRYWGPAPKAFIKGRALVIHFSFGDPTTGLAGLIGNPRWGRIFQQVR